MPRRESPKPPSAAGTCRAPRAFPGATPVAPNGTFKSADELRAIYLDLKGVEPNRPTIVHCRIGERSSHKWIVLSYLLGLKDAHNYDGSWTEYGSVIGSPIER